MKKILFQGDSITDGGRGRTEDLNHIFGHSYPYLIAAHLGYHFPQKDYHFINRGVSGEKVFQLYARWQQDTLNHAPDILSILIGINDANFQINQPDKLYYDNFEQTYIALLDETKIILPQVQFVLMEPFMLDCGNRENFQKHFNALKTKQQIIKKLSELYGAIYVPLQKPFEEATKKAPCEYWVWDSVHPTAAGHSLIADEWLKACRFLEEI